MMNGISKSNKMLVVAASTVACVIALMLALSVNVAPAQALGRGDVFTKAGNTYKITDYEWDDYEVRLVSYGSTDKTPVINKVSYKGKTFKVEQIGKNAFNTAAGHKITSVKLGVNVDEIHAKAFYGCKKLKLINLRKADVIEIEREYGSFIIDDIEIGKNAFKNAGTKSVKVLCGKSSSGYQKAYKKALMKRGMRSSVTVAK